VTLTDALQEEFDAGAADLYVRLHLAARLYCRHHGAGKRADLAFARLEGAAFALRDLFRDWEQFGLSPPMPTHPLLPELVEAAFALPHVEYGKGTITRMRRLANAALCFSGEAAP
jgi:hypothetical protein